MGLLAADVVDKALGMAEGFEPTATNSMQRDVADGKPFELEAFSGAVVHLEAAGVPTPVHRHFYALLRPALARGWPDLRGAMRPRLPGPSRGEAW